MIALHVCIGDCYFEALWQLYSLIFKLWSFILRYFYLNIKNIKLKQTNGLFQSEFWYKIKHRWKQQCEQNPKINLAKKKLSLISSPLKAHGNILIQMLASLILASYFKHQRHCSSLFRIIVDVIGTVSKAYHFQFSLLFLKWWIMAIIVQASEIFLGNNTTIFNKYFKTNFVNMLYLFVGFSAIKKDKL